MTAASVLLTAGLLVGAALPAAAQSDEFDKMSVRPLGVIAVQRFSAATTFDAVFDQPQGVFFGGGVLVSRGHVFAEISASRFSRTGERGFAAEGEGYGLGIPLTISVMPIEVSAGYRFRHRRVIPYVGTGLGFYRYQERSSSDDATDEVHAGHAGWLLVAGTEVPLRRRLAIAADVKFTAVPGILGKGGLSLEADEQSLGGVSAQFKVVVRL